jgi:hypothetical protein
MEIKTYLLSANEVASAVDMVVYDEFSKHGYEIVDVTGITVIVVTEIAKSIDELMPDDILSQMERFFMQFDCSWNVYMMHTKTEVCGLIAFTDM